MLPKSASPAGQVRWNLDDQRCGRGEIHPIAPADAASVALASSQKLNQRLTEELKHRDTENAKFRACVDHLEKLFAESRHEWSPTSTASQTMKPTKTILIRGAGLPAVPRPARDPIIWSTIDGGSSTNTGGVDTGAAAGHEALRKFGSRAAGLPSGSKLT